jgi:hypothetical protein
MSGMLSWFKKTAHVNTVVRMEALAAGDTDTASTRAMAARSAELTNVVAPFRVDEGRSGTSGFQATRPRIESRAQSRAA